MWILFPSFLTAFTVVASFEVAGRMKGAKGWFDWLEELPWGNPAFSSVALAMLIFAIGIDTSVLGSAVGSTNYVHS